MQDGQFWNNHREYEWILMMMTLMFNLLIMASLCSCFLQVKIGITTEIII